MANTKSNMSTVGPQLEKLFTGQLQDMYWAEKHLTKALPKMAKLSTEPKLKEAIESHLGQTEEHVSRLEEVFELLGSKPQAKKCEAMEGLVKEADETVGETEANSPTRDAAIILCAQKVEHYEIATYGTLVQMAVTMGRGDVSEILDSILEDEKEADEMLTQIAENNINREAAGQIK